MATTNEDHPIGQVSANTLFHFTNKAEHLINIFQNEFRPRYSLEDFRVLGYSDKDYLEIGIPMVCFCDLPLMQIKRHLAFYGNYGIGLSKEWGKKNNICPVLYTYPNSPLGEAIEVLLEKVDREHGRLTTQLEINHSLETLLYFIKPYEGNAWRGGRYLTNIRFYNEREWRFVPRQEDVTESNISNSGFLWPPMEKEVFLDETKRARHNSDVYRGARLSFSPNDIRYIIVENEEEILPMIKDIRRIKNPKFDNDTVDLLTTRIISSEQIREDF